MSDQGFFDFRQRLTQRSEPAPAKEKSPPSPPLTVSQLTNKIEAAIKTQLPGSVLVQGEVSNFKAVAAAFLAEHAAIQVPDAAGLEQAIAELLGDDQRRSEMGARALQVVRQNLGATERTVQLIAERLS